MPLIILFLIIPLIEIAVFIAVDDKIGLLNTLLICIITAIAGGMLLKFQGKSAIHSIKDSLIKGEAPIGALFDGVCLVAAGALLMTPGFVTDIIGFLLFWPYFRLLLRRVAGKYGKEYYSNNSRDYNNSRKEQHNDIIDADYTVIDKDSNK